MTTGMGLAKDEEMGTTRITPTTARHAMAYLRRHNALDCAEMLGLTGYHGKAHRSGGTETTRVVWRPGAAR